jgi:hypothetical protein
MDGEARVSVFEQGIARLVAHEVDHLSGVLYRARMRPGVEPVPVAKYRGRGSAWRYGIVAALAWSGPGLPLAPAGREAVHAAALPVFAAALCHRGRRGRRVCGCVVHGHDRSFSVRACWAARRGPSSQEAT